MNVRDARRYTQLQAAAVDATAATREQRQADSAALTQKITEAETAATAFRAAGTPYEQQVDSIISRLLTEAKQVGFEAPVLTDCGTTWTCETPDALAKTLHNQVDGLKKDAARFTDALNGFQAAATRHHYATSLLRQQQDSYRAHQQREDDAARRVAADNARRAESRRVTTTWLFFALASLPLMCCGLFLMWVPFVGAVQVAKMRGPDHPQRSKTVLTWVGFTFGALIINWLISGFVSAGPLNTEFSSNQVTAVFLTALALNIVAVPLAVIVWRVNATTPTPPQTSPTGGWNPQAAQMRPPSQQVPPRTSGPPLRRPEPQQPAPPPPPQTGGQRPNLPRPPSQQHPPGGPHHG